MPDIFLQNLFLKHRVNARALINSLNFWGLIKKRVFIDFSWVVVEELSDEFTPRGRAH